MKRYDPRRADSRSIVEKAYSLIFAMTDDEATRLSARLRAQADKHSRRAKLILGHPDRGSSHGGIET